MRLVPTIPIDLDKPRNLKFTFKALRLAEQELSRREGKKVSLPQLFAGGNLGFGDIGTMLWAGLTHEEPDLTLDIVEEMLGLTDVGMIFEKIGQAWQEGTGTKTKEASNTTSPLSPSTGSRSGA